MGEDGREERLTVFRVCARPSEREPFPGKGFPHHPEKVALRCALWIEMKMPKLCKVTFQSGAACKRSGSVSLQSPSSFCYTGCLRGHVPYVQKTGL